MRTILTLAALAWLAAPARAQEVLLPDQSSAKARELIQASIEALGGQRYLDVRDIYRTGRLAQFGTQGDLTGFIEFFDFVKLPEKNRTEFSKRRNIITLYTGEEGWELDRGGVSPAPPDSIERYREALKKDLDNLFRFRLNEPGMIFRYEGSDILDLKQVDWVEVVDRERYTVRIAFDRATHLPQRVVYLTRDLATRMRVEEVEFLSNWHRKDGVMTPMQIARERNGRKVYQAFFREYSYNTGLDEEFFTRASLDSVWSSMDKKGRRRDRF
jgi:hypothetical protein